MNKTTALEKGALEEVAVEEVAWRININLYEQEK